MRFRGPKIYSSAEMERVRLLYQAAEGRLLRAIRAPRRVLRVLRVRWDRVTRLWELVHGRVTMGAYRAKGEAITAGRLWCRAHAPSPLVIRNKCGRIVEERTYGHDPRRHPG